MIQPQKHTDNQSKQLLVENQLDKQNCTKPRFQSIPSSSFSLFRAVLSPLGPVSSRISDLREFAAIGRYYATESMLLWDEKKLEYSDNKTQEFGDQKIESYYESVLNGELEFKRDPNQKLF